MNNIKNNSYIFGTQQDKLEILNGLSNESLFLNLKFYDDHHPFATVNKSYYFYLFKHYGIKVDLAKRLIKYFIYLEDKTYTSDKLNQLVAIKNDLLNKQILTLEDISLLNKREVFSINQHPVPSFIKHVTHIDLNNQSTNDVSLIKTADVCESVYYVLEKVIDLLNESISIDDIVILNSNSETDLMIEKLFYDAHIPVAFNKRIKLNTIPDVIQLINILEDSGFKESKTFLNKLIKQKSNHKYVRKLINIYNNYLDQDLQNHPDILITILNNESVNEDSFVNCVNLYSLNAFNYQPHKHYIVLNYTDSYIPIVTHSSHYLNVYELAEINYVQDHEMNDYLIGYTQNLFNKINHLYLVFNESEDNHYPHITLHRQLIEEDYIYTVKNVSYLNTFNQLNFAKDLYDYKTYYLKNNNFERMYSSYHKRIIQYTHEFTGIKSSDLNNLLHRNNTITPYKLETYHLCHFKYLLDHLLKLAPFETTINQFLGNLSHKVLELYTNDKTIDIDQIIDDFEGFPEDITYKEHLYKTAIKKEIKHLLVEIDDLHDHTAFNDIKTEYQFKIPFKLDQQFYLSGIIDKVMLSKQPDDKTYFVLIDYKLGDKDFNIDQYNKNIQLQLPMYLYAYKQNNKLYPCGFFYQTTSLGRYKCETNSIKKNYVLKGAILENKALCESFNPELDALKGIRISSKGFYKSKRLFTEADFEAMAQHIEDLILDMVNNLKLGNFEINPMQVYAANQSSPSCEYCEHYSICYNKSGV